MTAAETDQTEDNPSQAVIHPLGQEVVSDNHSFDSACADNSLFENLPTLQIALSLTEEEKTQAFLRWRSHAMLVSAAAHATWAVTMASNLRELAYDTKNPSTKYSRKLQTDARHPDPLAVTLLGGGRLARALVKCFLSHSFLRPEQITISTRRPEIMGPYAAAGVKLCYSNAKATRSAHIVFCCVSRVEFPNLLKQIAVALLPTTVLWTFIPGYSVKKVNSLIPRHTLIIKPNYNISPGGQWTEELHPLPQCLHNEEISLLSSPVRGDNPENPTAVVVEPALADDLFLAYVDMASRQLKLTLGQAVRVVNEAMFGLEERNGVKEDNLIEVSELGNHNPDRTNLAISLVTSRHVNLIANNKTRSAATQKHYTRIFEVYEEWCKWNQPLKLNFY